MGAFLRLVDAVLFIFFLSVALTVPVMHSQQWLPNGDEQLPGFLVNLKNQYLSTTGDYLLRERPLFFVGLVWPGLLLLWPLSVANVYGAAASKSWFSTTCLIYGVSVSSGNAAIIAEVYGSGKASEKLLMMYLSISGFGVLAILRGLLGNCCQSTSTATTKPSTAAATKSHAHARKKRA